MTRRRTGTASCQMVAVERVFVLPGIETLVRVRPRGRRDIGWGSAIASNPAKKQEDGLAILPTLFDPGEPTAVVLAVNGQTEPVCINKGDVIARAEEFVYTQVTTPTRGSAPKSSRSFPEHLRCVLDTLSDDCTAAQREEVTRLLTDYSDVFMAPDGQLGHTQMAEHHIDTGSARPVKQRPRRVPLAKRADAESEVKKMLQKGLIEPSHSPWASPIVLVTKRTEQYASAWIIGN